MSAEPHTTADGFVTTDDTDFLAKVSQALSAIAPNLSPQLWHSGGGCFGIQVTRGDGARLLWGNCDDYWTADVEDADGEIMDGIQTDHSFEPSENLQRVADMLRAKSEERSPEHV